MSAHPLRLLLIGGGHAHLAVLEIFARHPRGDVELTLVSAETAAFYSGMVPGVIAGHYAAAEAQIPLAPLAKAAGATFLHDEVTVLDVEARAAYRSRGAAIAFDVVSLDLGSTPARTLTADDAATIVPVKPVEAMLAAWRSIEDRASRERGLQMTTVGGGLGGIELTLAMAHRLRATGARFCIVTRDATIAAALPAQAQALIARVLADRGIEIVTHFEAKRATSGQIFAADGGSVPGDVVFLASHAAPAGWLAPSGLAVDADGFVAVNETLQSLSHPFVFAAGDVAAFAIGRLPKSGVVAVRQGRTLARNLWSLIDGVPLEAYRPQRDWLALVGTGDAHAIAVRGRFALYGKFFWRLKRAIDRRFVERHRRFVARS
jgi:selenide,water dikinase